MNFSPEKKKRNARQIIFGRTLAAFGAMFLMTTVVIGLADQTPLFKILNGKTYDVLFCVRSLIHDPKTRAPVAMVDVDDRTLSDPGFQIPMALWHEYFGVVMEEISASGALAIGLDYLLPGVLFDDRFPGYSQVWRKAIIRSRNSGTPVVTGFFQKKDRRVIPHKTYLFALGAEHVGYFNLTHDGDDVVRRQRLRIDTKHGESLHSFAHLLFRLLKPDHQLPLDDIYIDFVPHKRFFPRHSFSEVYRKALEGDLFFLKQQFQNKIVIIGNVDSMSQDYYSTPLRHVSDTHKRLAGPDIHASVIQTLHAGRFFRNLSTPATLALYFALSSIAGIVIGFPRFKWAASGLFSLIAAFFLVSVWAFLNFRVVPLASGLTAVALTLVLASMYRYGVLNREKRRLHHLFEMFLTSRVARGVMQLDPSKLLEGEEKRLCILFSDIRGFTTFSRENKDMAVVRRLNEYFGPMSDVITRHGGVVSRFFGDGMLAFFGAFDETDNPSLAGARAALEMLRQLRNLNDEWRMENKETFDIGIGLHTGHVALGGVGSLRRMEFTLTGDAANLASRVEGKTKDLGETILISDEVHKDIHDKMPVAIVFEDKGVQSVKGRDPIRLYAMKIKE
jgi:adenylate cyclase